MLLHRKPVKAIQWNGKNTAEVEEFVTPNAVLDCKSKLLIIDKDTQRTMVVPMRFWLTKPVEPYFIALGAEPDEYTPALRLLHPGTAQEYFAIELEDTDITLCETCQKPANQHLPMFDEYERDSDFEYDVITQSYPEFQLICPPDFENEIDKDMATEDPEATVIDSGGVDDWGEATHFPFTLVFESPEVETVDATESEYVLYTPPKKDLDAKLAYQKKAVAEYKESHNG